MQLDQINFISGLPRLGSTLLSATWRQNSQLHVGITSPVAAFGERMLEATSEKNEYLGLICHFDMAKVNCFSYQQ